MISAKVTIHNTRNDATTVRYSRNSTIGDCVKACLNAVDQETPLGQLPDTYQITVDLRFAGKEVFETEGWKQTFREE